MTHASLATAHPRRAAVLVAKGSCAPRAGTLVRYGVVSMSLVVAACMAPTESKPVVQPKPAAEPAPAAVQEVASQAPIDPSCVGIGQCQGESCCTKLLVPAGTYPDKKAGEVRVDAFYLDKYELTIGRVRKWVEAGKPMPGDGTLLGHDSAGKPVRWASAWHVMSDEKLKGWERYDTWTRSDDSLPKNHIDWYTAEAVCHFAGGRLPSDAEWRYAAVGGEEDRPYPWGSEEQTPELAVYNCMGDGNKSCSKEDVLPVGSRPKGAARWGHMDLAGSMFEWTLDAAGTEETVNRGGGFCYIGGMDRRHEAPRTAENIRRDAPNGSSHMVGARCAFDVPGQRPTTASR